MTDKTNDEFDSTVIAVDSTTILNVSYKFLLRTNDTLYISNTQNNYLQKFRVDDWGAEGYFIDDFNHDGLNDFRYAISGNTDLVEKLFLFDRQKRYFTQVKGFDDFPDPQPIPGTKYYYSYHKSGCADADWDSDLFYIDNFKAIKIGNISGLGCADQKQGVYIFKIAGEKKILLDKLPIEKLGDYKDYKWGLIKEYWFKNFLKFVPGK